MFLVAVVMVANGGAIGPAAGNDDDDGTQQSFWVGTLHTTRFDNTTTSMVSTLFLPFCLSLCLSKLEKQKNN